MPIVTSLRRLIAGVAVTALTGGLVILNAPPSSATFRLAATRVAAAPAIANDAVSADSTLSGLSVTGNSLSALSPAFLPTTHDYEVIGNDDSPATVTPTLAQNGATAVVAVDGTVETQTAGVATVPLARGENDITVTVTSSDLSSSTVYRVTVWRLAAPSSQIVSLVNPDSSTFGGTLMTVTLTHGSVPDGCTRYYLIGGQYAYLFTTTFDPITALSTDQVYVPAPQNQATGAVDLQLINTCSPLGGGSYQAVTTDPGAVTYNDDYHVISADIPATVTSGTAMVLNGPDVTAYSAADYWLTDAQGNIQQLYTWDYTGNNTTTIYVGYPYGTNPWYAGSGSRTLHVGFCPPYTEGIDSTCTSTFSQAFNWVAPIPTNVSFSPASGPASGGNLIKLSGRFVLSGVTNTTVKVGGQTVPSWTVVNEAANNDESFLPYTQGLDVITFPAPASAMTGPVPITVTNDLGTTVARGTYTYSAQPAITSITPAAVAYSGGSVITVHGRAFGSSGTPTVIVNGVKSPFVTAVSPTQLTAVVPAFTSASAGAVPVSVSSPQGGGVSSPASLTLVAPSTPPTVTKISPASGQVTDDVTLTGTGFGGPGTAGVSIDGQWALVTASSSTSITFEVPATDTIGLKTLVVGAVTGTLTRNNAFTVIPANGVAAVTPATVPSYATGSAAKLTLTGAGFASTGTVKVGSAAAVAYSATGGGTQIAGVAVPTGTAGSLPIVVTPTGQSTPLRASVVVTAPAITYFGPDPYQAIYGPANIDADLSNLVPVLPTSGGPAMRIQGSGFGPAGTLKLGTTTVTPTTWTDTAITFTAPAHAAATLSGTVTPTSSVLAATQAIAVTYAAPAVGLPTMAQIASGLNASSNFDPVNDVSDAFTLTGTNLAGTDSTATRLVISDGTDTFTVVPTAVTATSLAFAAPRGFTNGGWKNVQVVTDVGTVTMSLGLYYENAGVQITVSPNSGLCMTAPVTATGSVTYNPADITIANTGELFGDSGTVTMDGVDLDQVSYTPGSVEINLAAPTAALTNPWGGKSIVITPDDTSLAAQSVGFDCAVPPGVTTTANGSTTALHIAAGTSYTLGATTTGMIGTPAFTATDPTGFEYVTAADYGATQFRNNVHAGKPVGAGDYFVRTALSQDTYASGDYLPFTPAPVEVVISGTPVTITPVSNNGATFVYKGQLGDGTGGSSTDLHYTATTTADPITGVTWQYRDSICDTGNPTAPWQSGLPKDVARSSTACGGDGVTPSSWDVEVASFTMNTTGTDRSIYYQATLPSIPITITPRALTVAAVNANKVYDGTTAATLGALTLTGALADDDISLANASSAGTFADPAPGVNKPVTLGAALVLGGGAAGDYALTNPNPTVVGTITKASDVLSLASSTASVVLSANAPVTITSTLTDSRTNQTVADGANAAPVVLTSRTPSICTITGTTVTAVAAGTCTIAGTEAASTNYTAATAASDPTSGTETIDIQVFAAAQAISVIADNLTVAVGDDINPTSQISGLVGSDSVDNVTYDYYSGTTLLSGAPTAPGNYTMVPTGGTLTAANPAAYSNPGSFTYVAGTLVITALPPTISTIGPDSGPTTGGTSVTITGTLLDTVTSIRIGTVTLRAGDFTLNGDGTALTFTTPAVGAAGDVTLVLVDGTATAADVFTYMTPVAPTVTAPGAPTDLVAVGGNGIIGVTFTPPVSSGGAPITSYQVSTDGGATWHTVATGAGADGSRTAVIAGVTNDTTYRVEVRALNRAGAGPASGPADARPVAPVTVTAPAAPDHVTAVGHDRRIAVAFVPPADTGGAAITSYQFSLDNGHTWHTAPTRAGAGGTRTATLSGVDNGVWYSVKVRAVNGQGAGSPSDVHRALPNAPALKTVRHPPAGAIAVPPDPASYQGPMRSTVDLDTSHNGTWAHPINTLGARQMTVGEAATLSQNSLFEFNSAVLTQEGIADVKDLAGHLRLAHAVSCEGYTDYAGEASHELSLSAARALAVCRALVHDGAHVEFKTHGYGGARPAVVGGTAVSRAANRRVVVLVTR